LANITLGEAFMDENILLLSDDQTLEKAAKYTCNLKDGFCSMVVKKWNAELTAHLTLCPGNAGSSCIRKKQCTSIITGRTTD